MDDVAGAVAALLTALRARGADALVSVCVWVHDDGSFELQARSAPLGEIRTHYLEGRLP